MQHKLFFWRVLFIFFWGVIFCHLQNDSYLNAQAFPTATSMAAPFQDLEETQEFACSTAIDPIFGHCLGKSSHSKKNKNQLIAIEVIPFNSSLAVDFKEQFRAFGVFKDGTVENLTNQVTWTSSDPHVALVSNKGLVKALKQGVTKIKAWFKGKSDSSILTVTEANLVTVELTPVFSLLPLNFQQQYTSMGIFDDETKQDLTRFARWGSYDPTIATISNSRRNKGLATGLNLGITAITATVRGVTGFAKLVVDSSKLIAIEVSDVVNSSLPINFRHQFKATGIFDNGTVRDLTDFVNWTSSRPRVIDFFNANGMQGLARTIRQGNAQIRATFGNITGVKNLNVSTATLVSIDINPADASLLAGYTQQFTALGTYSDGSIRDVTQLTIWRSSNNAVLSISNTIGQRGLAAVLTAGTTTVSATFQDNIVGSTSATVTGLPIVSIAIMPSDFFLVTGESVLLFAIATFTDGQTRDISENVLWSSSNPNVVAVSNSPDYPGLVTGLIPIDQFVTITASNSNAGASGSTQIFVVGPSLASISPSFGPSSGGNTVTITGDGFDDVKTVNFGPMPAPNFTILNDNTIQAQVPAGEAGTVAVTMEVKVGQIVPSSVNYTYQAS